MAFEYQLHNDCPQGFQPATDEHTDHTIGQRPPYRETTYAVPGLDLEPIQLYGLKLGALGGQLVTEFKPGAPLLIQKQRAFCSIGFDLTAEGFERGADPGYMTTNSGQDDEKAATARAVILALKNRLEPRGYALDAGNGICQVQAAGQLHRAVKGNGILP